MIGRSGRRSNCRVVRDRINSRMLQTLRERRTFFGGDSAHVHSPAGGQGVNTGIQDMIDLGWKLAMV